MESIERSWDLMKRSFAILQSDNELMLFPIASAFSSLVEVSPMLALRIMQVLARRLRETESLVSA